MIVLSCNNIGFSVGSNVILEKVSFSLNEGDRLGIVGTNGAGKSTLLKMICGSYIPSDGSVHIQKGAKISFLQQNDTVDGRRSVYDEFLDCCKELTDAEMRIEQLTKAMDEGDSSAEREYHILHEQFIKNGGYEYKSRLKGILTSLGFEESIWQTECNRLSGGQKTRLALGKVLFSMPDILILDEPTNHLDTDTLKWLEDFLKNYRKTVIIVSHDRYFLDRTVEKILDIEHHEAKLYNGNYSTFIEKKKKDRIIQERHYKNQQREIERIEAYIALQRRWNRERNIIAAESRQKMLDRMEKAEKPQGEEERIRLKFNEGIPSGDDVLKVKGLSKAFPGKRLFSDLSFEVKRGDRLFIIGKNGCGKSTLLKILMNRTSCDSGGYNYGYNLTVGYYDQENQNLSPQKTVLDELWDTDPMLPQFKVRSALALFHFRKDDVEKTVSVLSGGERARLTFAKLVLKEHNLLVLDEPTNHLDIASKEVLEDAFDGYNGTLIAVSHDRYFINKLATKILDFNGPEGKPFFFCGNYSEYERYKAAKTVLPGNDQLESEPVVSESKRLYIENRKNQSELRKARTRLERAKEEAQNAELALSRLEAAEAEYCTDYQKLSEIFLSKQETEDRLLSLYEEIDQLENKLK